MHHKWEGLHDQSSSVSRVTAGAAGLLILTQQYALRPGRYGDPSRFDTMPSQPSAQACSVNDRAVDFEMLVEDNIAVGAVQKLGERLLTHFDGLLAQVLSIQFK